MRESTFFMQYIVNLWNSLSQEVVEADSITRLKKGLDQGLATFGPLSCWLQPAELKGFVCASTAMASLSPHSHFLTSCGLR